MPKTEKRETGDWGENLAVAFLKKHGFNILERNYLKKWGEIDIVASKSNTLHFIEVKTVTRHRNLSNLETRPPSDEYEAEDNMHSWKIKRLHKAMQTYLLERKVPDEMKFQLDLVVVELEAGDSATVRYMPDI